jgi:GTP-binding protein
MLIDNVTLTIKAGNGGNGIVAFKPFKGGPDGGNGGNGGNIYFQGSNNLNDLREFRFKKKIRAEDGIAGKKKKLFGRNGEHLTIHVPLGTHLTDMHTHKTIEITDTTTPILLARGGRGGRGNDEFKTSTNQTPYEAEEGTPGEEKELLLELKIIADIGLIGLPNAGKSSLLAMLTNADPKIGNYPFTTLEPNIGVLGKYTLADIPGLIEGASTGRGLGVTFLKHIEKTKILLHCIDSTDEHAEKTYKTVRSEFEKYSTLLLEKPEVILLTKTDLSDVQLLRKNRLLFEKQGKKVLTCSIYDEESMRKLKKTIEELMA